MTGIPRKEVFFLDGGPKGKRVLGARPQENVGVERTRSNTSNVKAITFRGSAAS
ncbi:MAG: hypothetical protein MZV70_36220 [Desulfobacterales bacterium]|nr:hypothetical protein [Desulfobacterales bacterium]